MNSKRPSRIQRWPCNRKALFDFYSENSVPVTYNSAFPRAEESPLPAPGRIALAACKDCYLVYHLGFYTRLSELCARHETSLSDSAPFETLAEKIAGLRSLASGSRAKSGVKSATATGLSCGTRSTLALDASSASTGWPMSRAAQATPRGLRLKQDGSTRTRSTLGWMCLSAGTL